MNATIILYFGVLIVGFYFLLVRPQRRQMAARRALVAAIRVGDEVVTAGGIHGRVATDEGDVIGLEIAPGVVIRIARGAISARPTPPEAAEVPAADDEGGTDGPADGAA
ncbi:MAG: preprotein translocase subunit YajC [Actinomycetes bacterium]